MKPNRIWLCFGTQICQPRNQLFRIQRLPQSSELATFNFFQQPECRFTESAALYFGKPQSPEVIITLGFRMSLQKFMHEFWVKSYGKLRLYLSAQFLALLR